MCSLLPPPLHFFSADRAHVEFSLLNIIKETVPLHLDLDTLKVYLNSFHNLTNIWMYFIFIFFLGGGGILYTMDHVR